MIDRRAVLEKLTEKKVQDYTLTVLFFFIFAFFVMFMIRPNLVTAFNLQKELTELQLQNREYENTILNIVNYQSVLETNRENFYLLDEAIPASPQLYKVVDDVRKSASESGLITNKFDVNEVTLTDSENKPNLKSYNIMIETNADIGTIKEFIDNFITQRRLKAVKDITISRNRNDDNTSLFRIRLTVEAFYL